MKKEALLHFSVLIIYFVLITLYKRWFDSPVYLLFWIGGIVGTLLPDFDHLIYSYISRPHDLTSQRARLMISSREVGKAADLLAITRYERSSPIFHTAFFQIFFTAFTFFVITSTGSLLGRGLVLAFLLHLTVDQTKDYLDTDSLDRWFYNLNVKPATQTASFYLLINFLLLVFFGLFF